ncbi:MAG: T9SS type A sorting domain-containing protein [Salibacteraceae bacterium]
MKTNLLLVVFALSSVLGFSQVNNVSIYEVQEVSISDLNACTDLSAYDGDTVKVRGIAIHDGNLTEVASSSVTGDCRPGIHLLDTANMGMGGDFSGIQIHGVEAANNSNPVTALHQIVAGDVVEITGVVGTYSGETQIYPLGNSSVTVLAPVAAPQPRVVSVGDLNNGNKENQLPTGEQAEGSLVMLNNVTVTGVNVFGNNRVSFDVTDVNGNTINVSDRFLVQKTSSHAVVNPSSPATTGSFVAPPVGLVYDTLIGIVLHSENGCTGGSGRGYELNPFDASHYVIGVTPPSITEVVRIPTAPTSAESPVVNCKVLDFDGTVSTTFLHYTNDILAGSFDSVAMTLMSGSQDEYTANIPAMADGEMIGYFIKAVDNDGNVSQFPATPAGSASNNVKIYTVRDNGLQIVDVQKVLDYNNDKSYYEGDTVTVTGVVAASARDYDLGYVYIQQTGASEWGGLSLTGNSDLVLLKRTEEVTVTGVIEEYYNFTRMNVIDVVKTGNLVPIEMNYFDPSDANLHATKEIEKYESMTVGFANPNGGLYITNEDLNFGDYEVGSSATATQSTRVTAGRQSNNAFSSLWVSLVTDTNYALNDGVMEVDTVITSMNMEMDTIAGVLYYGFSNFKLMPRNNDDIINLSENGVAIVLDTTDYNYPDTVTSVVNVKGISIETLVYPNPATDVVSVTVNGINMYNVAIYDLSGRMVNEVRAANSTTVLSVNTLENGVYLMKVSDLSGNALAIEKVIIKH